MREARNPMDGPALSRHTDEDFLTVFVRNVSWRMEWHFARQSAVCFGVGL